MKFIKKQKKLLPLLFFIAIIIFLIYKCNNKNNLNYTAIGDNLTIGKDSYGIIDYSYSDYIKDHLKENKYLNSYIKSFSSSDISIQKLHEDILINKKVTNDKKTYNIRNVLRESTVLTISLGLNDLIYSINILDNKTNYNLNRIIKKIEQDFDSLLVEIKRYYQNDIYIIGYYERPCYDEYLNKGIKKLNNMFKNKEEIIFIEIEDIAKSSKYFPNPRSYYPNKQGYKVISLKIIDKITKKLEKD